MYNRKSRRYTLPPISNWRVWRGMPLEVACNNHSPAPIYGGYLPRSGVYCGACCAPGAVSAYCTCRMCWVYICMCCGAWSTPGDVSACCTWLMCWLYVCVVVLGAHLVLL